MISYLNTFTTIQPWFHNIIHSNEFIDEFIIWILIWFHNYEFNCMKIDDDEILDEFIHIKSDIWFHYIIHDHEFISELIYDFI